MSGAQPEGKPRLLLYSSLFPSSTQPNSGLFIRERLRNTLEEVTAVVVSPQPWFPFQNLLRLLRPGYRPAKPLYENYGTLDIYSPRFFALPVFGRCLDGFMMALGSFSTLRRLHRDRSVDLIDAHFAYPDGYAASLLGAWLKLPFLVTLRGTETRLCRRACTRSKILHTLKSAAAVVTVANSLRDVVVDAGADGAKVERVGNGVDIQRFRPINKDKARESLGLIDSGPVIVSVGGLVPRKGFHRVLEILPRLRDRFPAIQYLIVGGGSPEGDYTETLQSQVKTLGLEASVKFLGAMSPDELHVPLSAADVFVLATSNEGWANVFLESMACGVPVVTTDVGGNPEVIEEEQLGRIVTFGDGEALCNAVAELIDRPLDSDYIRRHAEENAWSTRVQLLTGIYQRVLSKSL